MSDIGTKTLEASDQNILLLSVENVLGVQDRWGVEGVGSGSWVLLKSFVSEDGIELITEGHIVDKTSIRWHGECSLKSLELNWGKRDSLSVEGSSEFLTGQVSLSEQVVILEEL